MLFAWSLLSLFYLNSLPISQRQIGLHLSDLMLMTHLTDDRVCHPHELFGVGLDGLLRRSVILNLGIGGRIAEEHDQFYYSALI